MDRNVQRFSIGVWLKSKWYIVLLVLVAVGGVYYWFGVRKTSSVEKKITIIRKTLREVLSLSGSIKADEQATLHFQTGGRLGWIRVKEGDMVKKYQGIASLDQRLLQKTLDKYLNSYAAARNSFDQTKDDNDQLTIALSQDIRDRAGRLITSGQAGLNNAVLDVELQSISKEYAYLYAPFEGLITHVGLGQPGVNISVTDTVELVNPKTLYFSVSADQTEVVRMSKGKNGKITLDAFPDSTIQGVIQSIAFTPKTDETGTVYEVKISINPHTRPYRIGMTGDAEFVMDERPNSIGIPSEYISEESGKSYVLKQSPSGNVKVLVQPGKDFEGEIEIKSGLFEGDVLLIPSQK